MSDTLILVVDDEQDIRDLLVFNLKREGYATLEAADGVTALELARRCKPSLILLDIMLPRMNGLDVCRELGSDRATANIPIIMLTARGDDVDRIVGFELGADDYVVKPFNTRELLLRLRAMLRRKNTPPEAEEHVLRCHGVCLDPQAHRVTVNDSPVELTAIQFCLLQELMRSQGCVRSREELLSSVWDYQFEGYDRTVDTHIKRLRARLGECADIIETVRGIGYRCKG
ncbi:response regulator transcription factor [uncultured Mailhella sp.]|uniref:response regulator n=1 Tax=uncultured Mailhella sp. TaxID=1981031 RepID=UPI002611D65A|nr:response regulator transcription factor [uncultured Mailhella sp.]